MHARRRSNTTLALVSCFCLVVGAGARQPAAPAKPDKVNPNGTGIYDSLTFKKDEPKAPANKPKDKRVVALGKRYAVIVGVGEAKIPQLELDKLPECMTDAANFGAALEKAGYECTILSEKAKAPTKANVLASLKAVCAKLTETDQIVFYASTHGGVINEQPSLAMKDAILELRDVKTELANSKALVKIILLDACRDQKGFPTVSSEFRDIHTILSCRPDEESITGEHGMSVFTEVLIEAMTDCKADRVKDGRLELDEILYYLDEQVPARAEAAEHGHSQNPTRSVVDPRSVNPILGSCEAPANKQDPQPVGVEGPVVRAPRNDLVISAALADKVSIGMTPYELYEKMGKSTVDELDLDEKGQGLLMYNNTPNEGDTTFVFFDKGKVSTVMALYKKPCTGAFDAAASRVALTKVLDGQPIEKLEGMATGWSAADLFEKLGCPTDYLSTSVGKNRTVATYKDVPTIGTTVSFVIEGNKVIKVTVEAGKKP